MGEVKEGRGREKKERKKERISLVFCQVFGCEIKPVCRSGGVKLMCTGKSGTSNPTTASRVRRHPTSSGLSPFRIGTPEVSARSVDYSLRPPGISFHLVSACVVLATRGAKTLQSSGVLSKAHSPKQSINISTLALL